MFENLLYFIFGLCIAYLNILVVYSNGKLEIDTKDPEKDTYRLNISNFDKLNKKHLLVLFVDKKADLKNK